MHMIATNDIKGPSGPVDLALAYDSLASFPTQYCACTPSCHHGEYTLFTTSIAHLTVGCLPYYNNNYY